MREPSATENAPLIAGVAQGTWRDGCPGPVSMLADVVARAAADAGPGRSLLERIDALCVVRYVSADHANPASLVADELGVKARERIHTAIGGDTPQAAIGELSGRIAAGELDIAVICGGEALRTLSSAMKSGVEPGWHDDPDAGEPDLVLGSDRDPNSPAEAAAGCIAPLMIYPLFEHALWAREGGTLADLQSRLGDLQARFSAVAATNPYAWGPVNLDPTTIATPTPDNRQVTLPYTKLMNSNIQTDQAAAVILMSQRAADELEVANDRRVYLQGSSHATEPWLFSERGDLARSPALGAAVSAATRQASTDVDSLDLLDIYSCFPCAVRIAANEIGYDPVADPRAPTVTGGLSFAGGPGNGYVLHSVATMTDRLRADRGGTGLVTAVGWYLTKHAAGIYSTTPPETAFSTAVKIDEPPAERSVVTESGTEYDAVAETATVIYERDGSRSFGILASLIEDGSRVLRSSTDPAVLEWLDSGAPVTGRRVKLEAGGGVRPSA